MRRKRRFIAPLVFDGMAGSDPDHSWSLFVLADRSNYTYSDVEAAIMALEGIELRQVLVEGGDMEFTLA